MMVVQIKPDDCLTFKRPLTRVTKDEVVITNTSTKPVVFKVKTTTPKLYCVRPNAGRVDPNSTCVVQVRLQAFKEEPAPNAECKDKFLVLAAPVPDAASAMDNVHAMWTHIEANDRKTIVQKKLRCVYTAEKEMPVITEESTGNSATWLPLPTIQVEAPASDLVSNDAPNQGAQHATDTQSDTKRKIERLQQELEQYKAKMSSLDAIEPKADTAVLKVTASTGISPALVALIALLSFVSGYLILPLLT